MVASLQGRQGEREANHHAVAVSPSRLTLLNHTPQRVGSVEGFILELPAWRLHPPGPNHLPSQAILGLGSA